MGEGKITEHVCNKLGIKPGETTPDGKFSLSLVECLGSCGTAPMFQLNFDYHENLTATKVDQILDSLT
jgi:NADH-quinone oxidoreductase subunit E